MSRFSNEDEFPEDFFPGTEGEGDEEFDFGADEQFMRTLELDERDLNSKILFKTIKGLEKSWFWRFKSPAKKLKMIKQAYLFYFELLTGNIPDDPEEEGHVPQPEDQPEEGTEEQE
jgi:hypothetical protein